MNSARRGIQSAWKSKGVSLWSRQLIAAWMCAAMLVFPLPRNARANPVGENVVAGSASFDRSAGTLQITTSDRVIINWQDFSIGSGELTRFIQPSATSAALNRVMSGNPSSILGTLQSNGQVFLINPNGILVGNGAQIDCGSFIASTLDVNNDEFMAGGGLHFVGGQNPGSSIQNLGSINALGGDVFLIAKTVENRGTISAPDGVVGLAAGQEVFLAQAGEERLVVQVTSRPTACSLQPTGVHNAGLIEAAQAELKAHGNLYALAVNNEGVVRATGAIRKNGHVILTAVGEVLPGGGTMGEVLPGGGTAGGTVVNSGEIVAQTRETGTGGTVAVSADKYFNTGSVRADGSVGNGGSISIQTSARHIETAAALVSARGGSEGAGGSIVIFGGAEGRVFTSGRYDVRADGIGRKGGMIQLLGKDILLVGARVDASGDAGGGTVLVGGDYQGKNPSVLNAQSTFVNGAVSINADARTAGDGGKVVVWADGRTEFYGSISARGGAVSGKGGFVEISGKEDLAFGGFVDASAVNGTAGTLLLDPKNLIIDTAGPSLFAFQLLDPNPGASDNFPSFLTALPNGNLVVADKNDDFVALNAGAVYLFYPVTGALLGMVAGDQASDQLGSGGVTVVGGNYVIRSFFDDAGAVVDAGSAILANGTTGLEIGRVAGDQASDRIGSSGITVVGGNYAFWSTIDDAGAVVDAGSVILAEGTTGLELGRVSGDQAGDQLGLSSVTVVGGNYAVASYLDDAGAVVDAGSVILASGATGVEIGRIMGDQANDKIGLSSVTAVGGNYVIASYQDDNGGLGDAGSAILANGTTGLEINRISGDQAGDNLGNGSVTAVGGNYVIASYQDAIGGLATAGSVILANGTTGLEINRIVGDQAGDQLGFLGVKVIGGNYLIVSQQDDNGAVVNAGSVILANGTTGLEIGRVSGDQASDQLGLSGVTVFGGNYAIASYLDDNGAVLDAGSVILASGSTGLEIGRISGDQASDKIGYNGVAVVGANYAIASRYDDDGAVVDAGSAILANGATGLEIGRVSGDQVNDQLGMGGMTVVGGNYAIRSSLDDNGAVTDAGSVILADGATGLEIGRVSGDQVSDAIGSASVTVVGGNYAIASSSDDNGAVVNAGSVILASGATGLEIGRVSGDQANDQVGNGGVTVVGGNFAIRSSLDDNGAVADAGSLYFVMPGATGIQFSTVPGQSVTISPGAITGVANGGTAVNLQANNDITVNSPIIINNPSGNGGNLTLQAGRSILINADITTDNGNLTLVANEQTANGVVDAQRDAGAAVVTMALGTTLNAGTGSIIVDIRDGAGLTFSTSGDITLDTLTAGDVLAANHGPTAGSDILRAQASSLITANSAAFIVDGAGGGNNIGSGVVPIRITVANLEAAAPFGGAFFRSPTQGVNLGGSVWGGLTGISLVADFALIAAGDITDSEASIVGGTMTLDSVGGGITLDAANTFSVAALTSAGNTTLNNSGALNLGASTVGGNLNITAAGAIGDIGNIAVTGTTSLAAGAGNSIALDGAGNDFAGAVSIVSGNNVMLVDSNTIDLGASTVSGNLSVTAAGPITDSGVLNITGMSSFTTTAGNAAITLDEASSLGGAVSLMPNGTGNATLTGVTGNLFLGTSTVGGNLVASSAGTLTDSGVLTVTGTSSFTTTAGNAAIVLDDCDAFVGAVSLAPDGTGSAVLTGVTGALDLGTVTAGGGMTISATGAITDSGILTLSGTASLETLAGNSSITLDSASAYVDIGLTTSGTGNATLTNVTTALELLSIWVGGNLVVSSAGAITDTGDLVIGGTSSFTTTAGSGTIELDHGASAYTGAVSLAPDGAGNAVLNGGTAGLILGTVTVGGTLTVSASSGAITQSGDLTVTGNSSFDASAHAITLNRAGNEFMGAVSLNNSGANSVALTDANAVALGASAVGSGTLTVNAVGITQTGAITQAAAAGAATFNGGAGMITLTDGGNDFTGPVSLNNNGANNAAVTDANAILLGASTIGGNLAVIADGAITQSGALTVAGTASFSTTSSHDITLMAANDFATLEIDPPNNATFNDINAIDLGTSTVNGTLTLTAGGAITQSGPIQVGVLAMTSGGPITLNDSANEVSTLGPVDRGGDFELFDRSGGLLICGGIDNGSLASRVTIQTRGGDLGLEPNTVIATTGDGNDVTLVTDQDFINQAGAGAITTSGTGRYLVYSTDPAFNTRGDLAFDFEEYSVVYPTAPDATDTGNGFFYGHAARLPPSATEPVLAPDTLNNFVANSTTLASDTVTVGDVVFAPPTVERTESRTVSTDAAPAPAGEDGDLAASSGNRSGGGDDTNPGGGGNEDGTANPGEGDGKPAAGEKEGEGDKGKEGEGERKAKGEDDKEKEGEKKDEKGKDKDQDAKGDAAGGGAGGTDPAKDDKVLPAGAVATMGAGTGDPAQIPPMLQNAVSPAVRADLQDAISSRSGGGGAPTDQVNDE